MIKIKASGMLPGFKNFRKMQPAGKQEMHQGQLEYPAGQEDEKLQKYRSSQLMIGAGRKKEKWQHVGALQQERRE